MSRTGHLNVLFLGFLAACGGSSAVDAAATIDARPGCGGEALAPGVYTGQRVILGDVARTYTLAVIDGTPTGVPQPLAVVFHDALATSTDVRAQLSLENGAADPMIFVYPDAGDGGWDVAADATFWVAMLDDLDAKVCVDHTRTFATGFGAGATFVNQLACEHGELVRAIAPVSGEGPTGTVDDGGHVTCAAAAPEAFVVHGNDDPTIPNPADGSTGGRASFRHWAYAGQTSSDYAYETEDVPPAPCVRALGLPEDHEVYGCFVDGVAHAPWPNAGGSIRAFFSSRR